MAHMKKQPRKKNKTAEDWKSRGGKNAKKRDNSQTFWNNEYKEGGHLALSNNASEDLMKFTRWLERDSGRFYLNPLASAVDLGCGNGRNLIHLAHTFGLRGAGYDISEEAVGLAKKLSKGLHLTYQKLSIAEPIPLPDASQTIALDMMASHFLNLDERTKLTAEIARVLKPHGWLFFKTFLLDEDAHAVRLLREHPAGEKGSYIHPHIGVAEHVFTEKEVMTALGDRFRIHKIYKSHRHRQEGKAYKRRSMSVYAQKIS